MIYFDDAISVAIGVDTSCLIALNIMTWKYFLYYLALCAGIMLLPVWGYNPPSQAIK